VSAGSHDITVEFGTGGSDALFLDIVHFEDTRFHGLGSLPDTTTEPGGPLPGPPDYATGTREFADASSGQQIVGGRLEATVNDPAGATALAISNDQGQNWIEAQDASVVDGEFAAPSSRIRARFTLGGYGERTSASPATGFKPQSVDAYSLFADLDETPVVINRSVDDHLDVVLREFADRANAVWAVEIVDGEETLVWTQPGTRETTVDAGVTGYSTTKRTGEQYSGVTVVGSPSTVRNQTITSNYDTATQLPHDHLVDGSETVYDPQSGVNYVRGSDYEISYLDGTVTVLSGGAMEDTSTYQIDYQVETRGSFALDSADPVKWAPNQSIPGLTSAEACEQAAITIVNDISEPLWEVEFSLPPQEVGFAVTDALQLADVPFDGPAEVREVSNQPDEIRVTRGAASRSGRLFSKFSRASRR